MLAKIHRLQKTGVKRVYKKGRKISGDYLSLIFLTNRLGVSRFSFIVPVKISKKASLRNKLKRRFREIARLHLSRIKKGVDVILKLERIDQTSNFPQIKKEVKETFKKAGLWIYSKD